MQPNTFTARVPFKPAPFETPSSLSHPHCADPSSVHKNRRSSFVAEGCAHHGSGGGKVPAMFLYVSGLPIFAKSSVLVKGHHC